MSANTDAHEIRAALQVAGLKRPLASVLAALAVQDPSTSEEIQASMGLHQPYVSHGCSEGHERGWIASSPARGPRGRPQNQYRLTKPLGAIVEELQKIQEVRERQAVQAAREARGRRA